jgi:hypothetical protein
MPDSPIIAEEPQVFLLPTVNTAEFGAIILTMAAALFSVWPESYRADQMPEEYRHKLLSYMLAQADAALFRLGPEGSTSLRAKLAESVAEYYKATGTSMIEATVKMEEDMAELGIGVETMPELEDLLEPPPQDN